MKKILILAANPIGTKELDLGKEKNQIEDRLRSKENFSIETKLAVRYHELQTAIEESSPHIVHFCGHGAAKDGLVFEGDDREARLIPTNALSDLFKGHSDQVECVVLNACYSKVQALAIAQNINYVIGMDHEIEDTAAIEFSRGFYNTLSTSKDYERAYEDGCKAIRTAGLEGRGQPVKITNKESLKANLNFFIQGSQKISSSSPPTKNYQGTTRKFTVVTDEEKSRPSRSFILEKLQKELKNIAFEDKIKINFQKNNSTVVI